MFSVIHEIFLIISPSYLRVRFVPLLAVLTQFEVILTQELQTINGKGWLKRKLPLYHFACQTSLTIFILTLTIAHL